jgi:hypothetical protein
MAYFLDLFSPETYQAFVRSGRSVSGFRRRQARAAACVKPGDKLICYLTKLSRWFGILEVQSGPYEDTSPVFYPQDDPFVIRFNVRSVLWLGVERAIPIVEDRIWNTLSFTREHTKGTSTWTGKVRSSLATLSDEDGSFLEHILAEQQNNGRIYPVDLEEFARLCAHRVRGPEKDITVTIPGPDEPTAPSPETHLEARESLRIQALLAELGCKLGMQIWIPRSDRGRVLSEIRSTDVSLLERLPLNYDDTTLRTIEQIDVLWLRRRSIQRAFEVEHTTSIYSGLLRMADLLALQPNMDIKLHIVAPNDRREKVIQELRRPVFSLLERGPLSDYCTYLSYESVRDLGRMPGLSHMRESVLEEYEEDAGEDS